MQWLTAILAFATTMLVFSLIVSALVETIHRIFRSRSSGLSCLLEHFYDQVLKPQLEAAGVDLDKSEFIKEITSVRAPIAGIPWFKRLTKLPTASFMERLGSTSFAEIQKDDVTNRDDLLKAIAQKYELFGVESTQHFESRARLWSVGVAMAVAWMFFVHPYDLMTTFMEKPDVAAKVAATNDDTLQSYEKLVKRAEDLKNEQSNDPDTVTDDELKSLFDKLNEDIDAARTDVDDLSKLGAPVGWPEDEGRIGRIEFLGGAICYPKTLNDWFWLPVGGLLVGLGAPFWARVMSQITQVKSAANSVNAILKSQPQQQKAGLERVAVAEQRPVTSEAFVMSANARNMAQKK